MSSREPKMDPADVVLLIVLLALVACGGSPAQRRIRQYFDPSADTPDNTLALRAAIMKRLPAGTPADSVAAFLAAHGVGHDGLSEYYPASPGGTGIVRVEYDSRERNIVYTSYGVRFAFDSTARLSDVRVARWLTGP